MIIVRSPLRIGLGGGGTDLPSYYEKYGGFVLSAAIDKYVYITVIEPFYPGFYLKYSEVEKTDKVDEIKHPIIREALRKMKMNKIEITSLADVPAGTGLGSSGSFTTGLIKALYAYNKRNISPIDLAEEACDIEINILKETIGKQDQYISAFGGISHFYFTAGNNVNIYNLNVSKETLIDLESNLLLFFTGKTHKAGEILKVQNESTKNDDSKTITSLHEIKKIGFNIRDYLMVGDTKQFGEALNLHWNYKKKFSPEISGTEIDRLYDVALNNGAIGGKLVGAGGGGFLLFYAKDPRVLRLKMAEEGLQELRFKFDFEGTKVILV